MRAGPYIVFTVAATAQGRFGLAFFLNTELAKQCPVQLNPYTMDR